MRVSPPGPAIAASQIALLEWRSVQRRRGDTGSVGALPSSNWHCRQPQHAARSAPPAPPARLTLAGAVRLPGRAPRIRSPRSSRWAARQGAGAMAAVRQLNAKAEVLGRSAALAMSCGAGERAGRRGQ